ncbi:hypothetical protein Ddye_027019 [Dipteronia dyeriana]|uniref:F-box domain-containing protein n=1 Tax=Dipteronia dyeriana TaxID=168575 RepID=A0AAD9WPT1_9ROSI|nr:hypothetical protein Ddye_027019 [Dipteronia dyeriana]
MSNNQVAYYDNKKIKVNGEREQESSWSLGLRRWEDLSLDILKQIFNGVSISNLSRIVSSVCHSWQLCCWHFLCWENNELNLRNTEAALGVVKEKPANFLNSIGGPCSSTEKTTGLVKLDLLGSSRITARGFAKALYNWKNVKGICFGKLRHEYFDQVIEEIGKNCSMLQIISLRMPDFHINRHNALVMIQNLHQVRTLRLVRIKGGAGSWIVSEAKI